MQGPTEHDQFRTLPVPVDDGLRSLDEPGKFRSRIVGRDASRAVAEQVLAVLEAHPCRAKSAAECMLEVVNPNPW